MAMVNFISHGTQDLYPTFLQQQRGFSAKLTSIITVVSMVGAICGGLAIGLLSDRWGRRRSMAAAALGACALIPLWVFAPSLAWILIGAFALQFMVQGAWGVIPAHINELSPDRLRGFFPGFAYQIGVLIASSSAYVEARLVRIASATPTPWPLRRDSTHSRRNRNHGRPRSPQSHVRAFRDDAPNNARPLQPRAHRARPLLQPPANSAV